MREFGDVYNYEDVGLSRRLYSRPARKRSLLTWDQKWRMEQWNLYASLVLITAELS